MNLTSARLVELGPDDAAFDAWCDVWAASSRADRPDDVPRSVRDHAGLARQLLAPGGARDGTHRAALVDGGVVGALRLILPLQDNQDVAVVDLAVHPRHRRRGIGQTLYDEALRVVAAAGRTAMITEVTTSRARARRPAWSSRCAAGGRATCWRPAATCSCPQTSSGWPPWRPTPGRRAAATSWSCGGTARPTRCSRTGRCSSGG